MSTPRARARWLRGVLIAVCSAVATAGAHAAAGGVLPRGAALIVAVLVCATVGAAAGALQLAGRRAGPLGVIAALALAQLLGHLTLAGGHHHHVLGVTPSMAAAHAGAAVVLGAAIASVEYLYVVCASVLCWLRLFACAALCPPARAVHWFADSVVAQAVLLRSGLGMRAPPYTLATAG
ncbi:hypothetical protein [Mycobacterium deserti]|uniref:Integral membrane protein n=1 Tax=Mycobacterium deserti TaxID=2978347 RepID=A0ABT2M647_9MYCO|nr:hypothetical protein [Mycobacterium deserti]MCT7657740.1 hypothetical protein [Mycobacterium deserti]